ncbi:hypothetical protein [Nostoc sp.]|uniref:hypothetical protein n=1 Tax=Nostoc sp. TaxID=1180 RepID=UPI003FA53F34
MSVLLSLGYALSLGFGKALSEIFSGATVLKRVERYRLTAQGMKTLVSFLSVIAVEMKAVNLSTPHSAFSLRH